MSLYFFVFVALIFLALGYSKIAKFCNIVDIPNERSSHNIPIIRGGGVLFFCAALLFFFISEFEYPYFIVGLTILSILSFLDDILTLRASLRLPFQFLAIFFILNSFQIEIIPIWALAIAAITAVGFINIYNFMDGINGITGMYGLAVLHGFWILNTYLSNVINSDLLIFTCFSLLIFGYFNFRRKAKFFAGDVGSVSLAAIILFIGFKFLAITNSPLILALVAVYGIDAGLTILGRILRKENIFKPHRQHLYQHLVDKKRISHLKISGGYALLQMLINLIIYFTIPLSFTTQYVLFIFILGALTVGYFILLTWCKNANAESSFTGIPKKVKNAA